MAISLPIHGRGSSVNPPNRFDPIEFEADGDALDADLQSGEHATGGPKTQYFRDASKSIIAYNDSPDIGFDASINPYRGCEHGCIYCYARPYHEYLGLSAGLDFETKIFAKLEAPELLRKELAHKSWQPQRLAMCGVTDAYQPVERKLRISRKCLAVLAEFRNPVGIVTKNHLVTRDIDLLCELAQFGAASVHVSITTLRNEIAIKMEPRASSPANRLDAIRQLAQAGVPVGVFVSPIIPGLTDEEVPSILKAAADAGAKWANIIPVRLPGAVRPIFLQWLEQHFPDRKEKIIHRIMAMRNGKLNNPSFHGRFKGTGVFADQLLDLFRKTRSRLGLDNRVPELSIAHFRVPGGQMGLFGA